MAETTRERDMTWREAADEAFTLTLIAGVTVVGVPLALVVGVLTLVVDVLAYVLDRLHTRLAAITPRVIAPEGDQ